MATEREKARIGEVMTSIRTVLVNHWDPIGVMSDSDWPRDEYDAYIGPIYSSLVNGDSAESIAGYLCFIEDKLMGLGAVSISHRLSVAEKLKSINIGIES